MTKDKLKDDIIRTICCLNSNISNKDRELLIKLLNSIVDYTNGENNNQNDYKPVMIDATELELGNVEYVVVSDEQFESIINSKEVFLYGNFILEENAVTQYVYIKIITVFKDKKKILLGFDKQDEFSIDYIDKEYRFHKKI
nr:MAG: hypothetical protein [Bacteriophage sp.]